MTSDTAGQRFDILVVGAGLTGTAAAIGLAHQGWRVALVESASREELTRPMAPAADVHGFEARVSALSPASERLLTELGAWPGIVAGRHCPYQDMVVWDGDGTGRIRFEAAELHADALGTIIENRQVVIGLMRALNDTSVTLIDGVQVQRWQPGGALTLSDGQVLSASLVVGADGPQSRLRQWAGLPTREWDYDQDAIVCTVRTRDCHRFTAWQRFATTGPLAFLPLLDDDGDRRYCSIVWSQDTAVARSLMALDDDAFRQALGVAIEHATGEVEAVSARFSFPLRQRHAKTYVGDRLALIGDAAHTIHPLAGQGANLGYADVRVLLEELARARSLGLAPADPLVLGRYQRRRKGDNLAMMVAMDGFKRLFAREELPVRWLRNAGMRWLDGRPAIKHRLAAQAMGIVD
ncbi:FAD-dependent monooxygenase [Marinobacter sp. C2H3]|uniref:FAD-dependent monooxygenase n=1 Tax=Marinobacter sp. C2H3 TaxID=3119003 RepID=UPI00300F421B